MPEVNDRPIERHESPQEDRERTKSNVGVPIGPQEGEHRGSTTFEPGMTILGGSVRLETAAPEDRETGETDKRGETDKTGETPETGRPEWWSEEDWRSMKNEVELLQRRVDIAIEAANELAKVDGLPQDMREVRNLAQDIRITGNYVKEKIWLLVREPDEQRRLSSAIAIDAAVKDRLDDVKDLEEEVRQLQERAGGGTTGKTSTSGTQSVYEQVLSGLGDLGKKLKKWLGPIWAVVLKVLTLKEWTIGGKLGTGPFGLAEATVSLKFGK
jgi:hypothetical protein